MSNKPEQFINHKELIFKILNKLAEGKEPLPIYLELYKSLLTRIHIFLLSWEFTFNIPKQSDIEAHTEEGKPYLDIVTLDINYADIRNLLIDIFQITEKYVDISEKDKISIHNLTDNAEIIRKETMHWFNDTSGYKNPVKSYTESENIIYTLLHGSLYPVLVTCSDKLIGYIPQEAWNKNYCPICGGRPDFSYLDRQKGSRWLVCSRCDANWLFFRLVCPFCNNTEIKKLAYYTAEDRPYRLYICDNCRHYIKCIDLRKTDKEVLIPLERVLTIDLDIQATKDNYM